MLVTFTLSLRLATARTTQIDVRVMQTDEVQDPHPWILITLPIPATIVEVTTNELTALDLPDALIVISLAISAETALRLAAQIRNKEES